ncbi:MAG: phospholipase D-like domain-containing protein [Candidatus Woesearchaeota archaeon]
MIAIGLSIIILAILLYSINAMNTTREYHETGSIRFHYCITENCTHIIVEELRSANNIRCAFYTLRHNSIIEVLMQKGVPVVLHEPSRTMLDNSAVIRTREAPRLWGLMHNKFCTYELNNNKRVITGSYNPSGQYHKHDFLIVIESDSIYEEYYDEHEEMMQGIFAGGQKSRNIKTIIDTIIGEEPYRINVTVLFCPEDNCEDNIIRIIEDAQEDIVVAAYTYTSERITIALLESWENNISIRFIADRGTMNGQGSRLGIIEEHSIPIRIAPDNLMHHKTMIIDNTIITGSMNYGLNANTRNDENILIIEDVKGIIASTLKKHLQSI